MLPAQVNPGIAPNCC